MCRLSIGIEDLDDITHDLRQALDSALNAAKTTEVRVCLLFLVLPCRRPSAMSPPSHRSGCCVCAQKHEGKKA